MHWASCQIAGQLDSAFARSPALIAPCYPGFATNWLQAELSQMSARHAYFGRQPSPHKCSQPGVTRIAERMIRYNVVRRQKTGTWRNPLEKKLSRRDAQI